MTGKFGLTLLNIKKPSDFSSEGFFISETDPVSLAGWIGQISNLFIADLSTIRYFSKHLYLISINYLLQFMRRSLLNC